MWPEDEKPSAVCIWIEIALGSAVVLAHRHERDERALEPVRAIREDADHIAGLVGDQQVMPVEVGAHAQSSGGPQAARKAATSRRTRSWADNKIV